jgi:hypothetical protein
MRWDLYVYYTLHTYLDRKTKLGKSKLDFVLFLLCLKIIEGLGITKKKKAYLVNMFFLCTLFLLNSDRHNSGGIEFVNVLIKLLLIPSFFFLFHFI